MIQGCVVPQLSQTNTPVILASFLKMIQNFHNDTINLISPLADKHTQSFVILSNHLKDILFQDLFEIRMRYYNKI